MKAFSLLLVFLILGLSGAVSAQTKEIYTNPAFETLAKQHKVVAILPFDARIGLRPNQMKSMTPERIKEMEKNEGLAVQSALQTYFLKVSSKDDYTVSFQDAATTNALLLKNNINEENIKTFTPVELAKVLGVDGIISGTFSTDKPMSDGASLALGLAVGFYGATNSGKTAISIHDGASGELLWKYEKSLSRSLGSDTNTIVTTIMRKASKKFPYSKIKD
ncbi:hypothetical protein ACD591_18475 [Rufibacter glacialis]|uniref:DUF3313 domain-containing protein n=1 Tax=Rufibacter glacialis TaxID=1259555 RepID=A0A5M8QTK1_9BACT|nr:hypothetical protein [Rufibacter glacialis]KAA6438184.1 hypothetical protein FOE74_00675 [Rufibacter glacialis]GGK89307.1 hypothetical protein GCM10011405_41340 [Rufibacter glacialis]